MPRRHAVKTFISDTHYHAYNRGVDKKTVFLDDQDYKVFLNLLKYYLSLPEQTITHPLLNLQDLKFRRLRPLKNLFGEADLLVYCLMPNHFHLIVKQFTKDGMTKLMRRLLTTYAMYFNKRYKREGYLFQGRYKAVPIANENYLLHLSRYIHLNPASLTRTDLVNYPYSSYGYYLGQKSAGWIKTRTILEFFNNPQKSPEINSYNSYQRFVEGYPTSPNDLIPHLLID